MLHRQMKQSSSDFRREASRIRVCRPVAGCSRYIYLGIYLPAAAIYTASNRENTVAWQAQSLDPYEDITLQIKPE
jgi:hypothetical protein